MTIGSRIRQLRLENDMSLTDFGKALGVADTTVMKWEKETCKIPFIYAIEICQKFSCTLDFLAEGKVTDSVTRQENQNDT